MRLMQTDSNPNKHDRFYFSMGNDSFEEWLFFGLCFSRVDHCPGYHVSDQKRIFKNMFIFFSSRFFVGSIVFMISWYSLFTIVQRTFIVQNSVVTYFTCFIFLSSSDPVELVQWKSKTEAMCCGIMFDSTQRLLNPEPKTSTRKHWLGFFFRSLLLLFIRRSIAARSGTATKYNAI